MFRRVVVRFSRWKRWLSENPGNGKEFLIEEAPGWREETASPSEANVKADRSKEKPINELQEESIEHLKKYGPFEENGDSE